MCVCVISNIPRFGCSLPLYVSFLPVKGHRGEPGHTRVTRDTGARYRYINVTRHSRRHSARRPTSPTDDTQDVRHRGLPRQRAG